MTKIKLKNNLSTVCNFNYLSELMGGKIDLIKKMMDTFLVQVKEELKSMDTAITKKDYAATKTMAHSMKSSAFIMGISALQPVLNEMEGLVAETTCSDSYRDEKLRGLNLKLNAIFKKAFLEIENYRFS